MNKNAKAHVRAPSPDCAGSSAVRRGGAGEWMAEDGGSAQRRS